MPAVAVQLESVTKRYGEHVAVDALTWSAPSGTIQGVIGPNGSGKTTTLRLILGLLAPDSGRVAVLGGGDPRAANDRVGYLPEERGLYRKMTVERQLAYFGRLKGLGGARLGKAIDAGLERFGLTAWRGRKIEALSKGMTQKVQFLAATLASPELVILDEPFSGLDPVNQEVLREAVLDLRRRGATVLLSTHDMEVAERMCDGLLMVFRGRKVLDGTLAEVQHAYGDDVIRLRFEGQAPEGLGSLPGVRAVRDLGREIELQFEGDPQRIVREALDRGRVSRAEVARPSLHDIFVRIAGPEAREVPENRASGAEGRSA